MPGHGGLMIDYDLAKMPGHGGLTISHDLVVTQIADFSVSVVCYI